MSNVLSSTSVVLLDVVAWFFFHMIISILALQLPSSYFSRNSGLYQTRKWEQGGRIWQRFFKVKGWKDWIPDGTIFLKNGYSKKQLHGTDADMLEIFLLESRRAEFTHWLSILPAPIFFLWNPIWVGWIMIVYAVGFNLPIILVQRYNRPRLEKLIRLRRMSA